MDKEKGIKANQIKDYALKHSAAHLLAHAVKELYPKSRLGVGPPLEDSFYYDFGNLKVEEKDLEKIENKMHELSKKNYKIIRKELPRKEAEKILKNEPFKLELLKDIKDIISFYEQGEFIDLCEGPHIERTGDIKYFRLLKTSAAYWKGDQKNESMTRIYGVVFKSDQELKDYFKKKEEAAKRDHRIIGNKLNLFSLQEESPGMVFFHPKGAVIYNELINFIRDEYRKRNYKEIITPNLFNKSLWLTSGHWEHYKDDMFLTKVEGQDFGLKPMNCPASILIYKTSLHSYKELPLRLADFGVLHRNELTGVLSGLFRVRRFIQDDAHIYVAPEMIKDELKRVIDFVHYVYSDVFKFEYHVELSTKPEKSMGDPKLWEIAEKALAGALKEKNINFKINPGEGAFYGPKIDFHIKDVLGRAWQCATIQVDFQMPERFNLTYEGHDSKRHTPVIIHRAILGSIERFMGILIEHFAGRFPLWLSPIQVRIVTVSDKNLEYARRLNDIFIGNSIRSETDERSETLNKKVRDAQVEEIPVIITIGDKEEQNNTLAVRTLDGNVKFGVKTEDFISKLKEFISNKSLNVLL